MSTPTLTVISGPPGAGKTTLAKGLADRIGCPAICRDEIKEGMVQAAGPTFSPAQHDRYNLRTLTTFFALLETLIRAEVSTIAEAAYQDRLWRPGLDRLAPRARVLIIRCRVTPAVARSRQVDRLLADPRRAAHADVEHLASVARDDFDWPDLDVPSLDLDSDADLTTAIGVAAGFVLSAGGR